MCRYVHNNSNSEFSDHTSSETTLHHLEIKTQNLVLNKVYLTTSGEKSLRYFALSSKKKAFLYSFD